jgi:hypothetical protein
MAWLLGVWLRVGIQREHRSLEHGENDDDGACMRALPSPLCGACVPCKAWVAALRGLYAVGRGRSSPRPCMHACSCRASLILPCFTHFSRVYLAYSVVRKLSESAWFGAKAFDGATGFNANIGAWSTVSMVTMSYVCALCHRLRVGRVCFVLACVLHSFLEYSYAIDRGGWSLRQCMLLPCVTHFEYYYAHD